MFCYFNPIAGRNSQARGEHPSMLHLRGSWSSVRDCPRQGLLSRAPQRKPQQSGRASKQALPLRPLNARLTPAAATQRGGAWGRVRGLLALPLADCTGNWPAATATATGAAATTLPMPLRADARRDARGGGCRAGSGRRRTAERGG